MCQRLEDCLVSRLGFRVFLVSALTIVTIAIALNIKFLAQNKANNQRPQEYKKSLAKTKVLIMDQGRFYAHLSQRIQFLRANQCPILNKCAFASHPEKIAKADAVVVVGGGGSTSLKTLLNSTLSSQTANSLATDLINQKIWVKLIRDPNDRRQDNNQDSYHHIISYLPGADVPLIEYSLSDQSQHDLFKSTNDWQIKNRTSQTQTGVTSSRDSNSVLKRERLVATIVNQCKTRGNREGYIEALKEHITVHVYGKCGAPCPGKTEEDCLRYLSHFYKFLLVFESEVCQHYISPHLLRVLASTDLIPVVFGGVNYAEFDRHQMVIDALNQTPKALAHYIKHLSKDTKAMKHFGEWKQRYKLTLLEWPCILCQRLRTSDPKTPRKTHSSSELCTSWPSLNFSG